MDNPSTIVQAFDRRLDHEVSLVVYGRGAICLGFDSPPPETAKTQDVADAAFLIRHDRITPAQLEEAFTQMKPIRWSSCATPSPRRNRPCSSSRN